MIVYWIVKKIRKNFRLQTEIFVDYEFVKKRNDFLYVFSFS